MNRSNLLAALFMLFVGAGAEGAANPAEPGTVASSDLPAPFRRFTSNVQVSLDGTDVVLQTNDVPNHPSPYFPLDSPLHATNEDPHFRPAPARILPQNIRFRIPLHPQVDAAHESTPLGPIGISLNGVVFFNQYNAQFQPLTREIRSFDQYNGHPQPQGVYHYHVEPTYLTSTLGKSALLGFLLDGFPVYGPVENGRTIGNADLDAFHGHFGPTAEYPQGIYHYHVTNEDPYINGGSFYGMPGTVSN
jgi:hypothetical protein